MCKCVEHLKLGYVKIISHGPARLRTVAEIEIQVSHRGHQVIARVHSAEQDQSGVISRHECVCLRTVGRQLSAFDGEAPSRTPTVVTRCPEGPRAAAAAARCEPNATLTDRDTEGARPYGVVSCFSLLETEEIASTISPLSAITDEAKIRFFIRCVLPLTVDSSVGPR